MLILYILFCMYACISGMKDAILYGKSGAETFKWNEHIVFNAERVIVLFSIAYASIINRLNLNEASILVVCSILAFSFFHNGFYFETARQINRPDYRYYSNSLTSTATLELSWFVRANMFLISIIILLVYIFIL